MLADLTPWQSFFESLAYIGAIVSLALIVVWVESKSDPRRERKR